MVRKTICVLSAAASIIAFATTTHARTSVESEVRQQFAGLPVMVSIARCESGFRQFDERGRVLKNPNSSATGVMQIMSSIHRRHAARLGYDIYTLSGNLGYAKHLFETEGTRPWNASRRCWS